jgi:hypothetical protein
LLSPKVKPLKFDFKETASNKLNPIPSPVKLTSCLKPTEVLKSPFGKSGATTTSIIGKKLLKVNISSCKNIQINPKTLSNSKVILSPYKNIDISNITKEEYIKTLTAKLNLNSKEFTPKKTPSKLSPIKKESKRFTFDEVKIEPIPEETKEMVSEEGQRRCVIF